MLVISLKKMYTACWAPNTLLARLSENFSPGARACWSGYSVFAVCGRYFYLGRVFLAVVNQRNGLVVSFNAVHRYTRLADLLIIGGARLQYDDVVDRLPIPVRRASLMAGGGYRTAAVMSWRYRTSDSRRLNSFLTTV